MPDPIPEQPTAERLRVSPADAGLRVDVFVAREMPGLSRTRVRQKIQSGEALLNGHRCASSTRLRVGDEIVVPLRARPASEAHSADGGPQLPVLFEDDHLLALDKPAGMATHPMGRIQSGTVIQAARMRAAEEIREKLSRGDADWYPRSVNRLDVYTSGVVLIALTKGALQAMQELLAAHRVRKEYRALVEGVVAWDAATIMLPLGSDAGSAVRVKMAARPDGQPSITRVRVLRRLPRHTLLEAVPVTGRQHQIRVHLAAVGHPVVGDLLYRDKSLFLRFVASRGQGDASLPARHLLHAARVSFTHPFTGLNVTIESPLPEDFEAAIAALE